MFFFENLISPFKTMDSDDHLKRPVHHTKAGNHCRESETEAAENERMEDDNDNVEEEFEMPQLFKKRIASLLGPIIPERKWTAKDIFGHK